MYSCVYIIVCIYVGGVYVLMEVVEMVVVMCGGGGVCECLCLCLYLCMYVCIYVC